MSCLVAPPSIGELQRVLLVTARDKEDNFAAHPFEK